MTQYSILVYHRDFEAFMRKLQDKGLLDIRQDEVFAAKSDKEFYPVLNRLDKVLAALKSEAKACPELPAEPLASVAALKDEELLSRTEQLLARKKELAETITEQERLVKEASLWGEFRPAQVAELREKGGVALLLGSASAKKFPQNQNEAQSLFPVQIVREEAGTVYFVWACPAEDAAGMTADKLGAWAGCAVQLYAFPEKSVSEREAELAASRSELAQVQAEIYSVVVLRERLENYKSELFGQLTYKTVTLNTPDEADGTLKYINGYLPTEKASDFEAFLDSEQVVYQKCEAEDLSDEERAKVPVQLRNRWFAKLFEPITGLFSLPDYRELDLTPAVAPFFMAFFGFCLGDAGYGLLIAAVGLYIAFKMPKVKNLGWLAVMFGIGTVIFGTLSGTFFGISLMQVEALAKWKSYFFDSNKMMMLSLVIGAVQIIFGMIVDVARITKMQGFKYALHRLGWVLIIVFGACLIGLPMLGVELPAAGNYVLYALVGVGALFALFYNHPGKNPLLNLGSGLWTTYNTATGLVGDLLSYIRLFALGLTGGILGSVFNSLGLQLLDGIGVPVIGHLLMLVILLFGHALNLALCILGALVHPIRLTFVEFYKNAGFVGGGKAYTPFAKK